MRFKVLAAVSLLAIVAGCTNDTLDSVDSNINVKKVSNKVEYQLSGNVISRMASLNIDRQAPLMIRIFKEEGTLEVWKADRSDRFQLVKSYKICAWSGKLGPKMKEGDRQAPEGFYPLFPHQLNPNSKYYLAINTGYPNQYDRANGHSGSHLMIHGACSSAGCYSMTDEQMLEIFAFARDSFRGGQKSVQLQAFPFRMTAENMARHRDNPHIEFWKMLKVGYDNFHVTKRPPEVAVCEKKYVFNKVAEGGTLSPTGACPAMTTPQALEVALAGYNKSYDAALEKAMRKYKGTVWIEPSEAQRKAVVADQRKGRELAYAPTGTSLEAGKLTTLREIEAAKKRAEQEAQRKIEMAERAKKAEEDRKAAELAKLAEDVAAAKAEIKTIGGVPVPEENPGIASLQDDSGRMPFWQRWLKEKTPQQATVPTEDAAVEGAVTAPADSRPEAEAEQQATTARTAQAPDDAATTEPGQDAAATVQTPAADEKPFWKFWEK